MTASEALETLNWNAPRDAQVLVKRARGLLDRMTGKAPLRYKVAAQTIIREFGGVSA